MSQRLLLLPLSPSPWVSFNLSQRVPSQLRGFWLVRTRPFAYRCRAADTMKLLFVHERFGAFGGAEVNLLLTATEFKRRGHTLALLHGPATGNGEADWREIFSGRLKFDGQAADESVHAALKQFSPDAIYLHKLADLSALESLVESRRPLARMVHDHDLMQ